MAINIGRIAAREKLILAGLFLAKYDALGLESLGFDSFTEAFNVIGYALGGNPASIKNYRDEFDPFFPNNRKGWHKRPLRDYCSRVLETHKHIGLEDFSALIKSFFGYDDNSDSQLQAENRTEDEDTSFAKRLVTGLAAEKYFESVYATLSIFQGYAVENTTRLGCGYDFRLRSEANEDFLAVEVKGLQSSTGNLSLTPKEYKLAGVLSARFFLFVVRNFREAPFHDIYQNPLSAGIQFARKERVVIQVSWSASV
jgi:hypothetical protein